MKRVSRLCLLAVLAVTAIGVTASSASAAGETVLCKVNQNPCAAGNIFPKGMYKGAYTQRYNSPPVTLATSTGLTFTCYYGVFTGVTEQESSKNNSLPIHASAYLNECDVSMGKLFPPTTCATTSVEPMTGSSIAGNSTPPNGFLLITDAGWTFECNVPYVEKFTCTYKTGIYLPYTYLTNTWKFSANVTKSSGTSTLCGNTGTVTGSEMMDVNYGNNAYFSYN